ncbi:unnamed protein product [Adineta steineri]|uniref:Uncharacterized protein n=1 Tax=Adineta steineri TaxID=433720 RepID=A0A813X889_9BILA|nr:unnamed protein product [Adineta steineri]CAF3656189.1 unnamed protein product [Adineta steineri]
MTLSCINVMGKPMLLTCDTYATSATCGSGTSSTEGNSDCDTCCNSLLERMFDCPPCRYFVLNNRQQGASCFCTVCFKQLRHRRRHHQQQNEQDLYPRFDV